METPLQNESCTNQSSGASFVAGRVVPDNVKHHWDGMLLFGVQNDDAWCAAPD